MNDINNTYLVDRHNHAFPLASFLSADSLAHRQLVLGLPTFIAATEMHVQPLIETDDRYLPDSHKDVHHTYMLTIADMALVMPLVTGYGPRAAIFAEVAAVLTAPLPEKCLPIDPAMPFMDRCEWVPNRLSAFTASEISRLSRGTSKLRLLTPAL